MTNNNPIQPKIEPEMEGNIDISFQHEDEETTILRRSYEEILATTNPDLDESIIVVIASIVVKKARYGVIYEAIIEEIIEDFNNSIRDYLEGK